ncbi:MAG: ribonuclease P protein component [Lentimicrobiaceae bacterium]|nr:ribonuclease P protein component [Lentimicrobiaceae bacterium]
MPHAADSTLRNTLRKHDRLKSSLEIEALYHENQFVIAYPLKCYYSFSDATENSCDIRAAFTVPKKMFKRAVDRNTLKRRMREAYRLNYKKIFEEFITQNDKQLKLFFIYVGKEMLDYGDIESGMRRILQSFRA